jgi:hypothetical protein
MNKLIAAIHAAGASLDTVMEDIAIAHAFGRIADVIGLTDDERAVLFGTRRDPSRVILALETISAALELLHTPEGTVAWLRAKIAEAPFHRRSPLALFADEGQMGVEIALLYLRTRLSEAAQGGNPAPSVPLYCAAGADQQALQAQVAMRQSEGLPGFDAESA